MMMMVTQFYGLRNFIRNCSYSVSISLLLLWLLNAFSIVGVYMAARLQLQVILCPGTTELSRASTILSLRGTEPGWGTALAVLLYTQLCGITELVLLVMVVVLKGCIGPG